MKVLQRSKKDKVFLGVCGGLGEYFDVDAVWFRLGFIVLALGSRGGGLVLYVLAALIMPEDPSEREAEKNVAERLAEEAEEKVGKEIKKADRQCRKKRDSSQIILGFVFVTVGLAVMLKDIFRIDLGQLWPLALIFLGVALLAKK